MIHAIYNYLAYKGMGTQILLALLKNPTPGDKMAFTKNHDKSPNKINDLFAQKTTISPIHHQVAPNGADNYRSNTKED